jgi:hypothetical protein
MQKQKEEEFSMVKTSTRIVGALALVAALVSSGPVLAAKPGKGGGGPGLNGDLNQSRTSVAVMIPVECAAPVVNGTTTTTTTATLSVKIFQSVGRLINIGTGSGVPTCNGQTMDVAVTVNAVTGLTFQPGPATMLITLTETATSSTPSVDPLNPVIVTSPPEITETGARIDLH